MRSVLVAALLHIPLLAACASTSPSESFRDVSAAVERRTGHALYWNRGTPEDAQVDKAIHDLLRRELTAEQAVQIALLNNRTLVALYEELSISQADVVQAGLLRNPTLSAGMTTAEGDRLDPNLEVGVAWDFLDLLMLPARKKIAATQLEATKMRVADAVLDLTADVKRAYFELQAAQQTAAMRQVVADAAQVSAELAAKQNEAGNLNDLSLANEQSAFEQFMLDLARARADVTAARERLTRLMGLWGPDAAYRIAARLPDLPRDEAPLEHLESLAVSQRFDLEALRKEREALGRMVSLVRSTRFTPGVGVGANIARLNDHEGLGGQHWMVAPNASLELPIFDQKQAVVARLEAMFRQVDDRLRAHAVDVRSEVRATRERVTYLRGAVARYREQVIPLRERVVALSQQRYDAMLLGVYQLLAAKQSEVNAYREAIEAARDYWLARVDLERAVGARLAATPASPQASPPAAAEPAAPHHDHHGG